MSLIKNALKALFGIGSYAIFQILLLSFISKFYGTELLGAYAFFFSVTATVFFFTNLGFRQLVVTSTKFCLLSQYIRLRSVLSILALLFILLIGVTFKSDYLWVCLFVALIRFLESLSEINYAFFQKVEKHGFQSKLLFIKSLLSIIVTLAYVNLGMSFVVLLCSIMFIHFFSIIFYEYPQLKKAGENFNISELINFSLYDKKLLIFAFPLGIGLFLINLNLNASRIFSGIYLEDIDTAVLASSLQLALGAAPIITGLCQVFLPRLSNLIKRDDLVKVRKLFLQLLFGLSFIGIIGYSLSYLLGEVILRLFFNNEIAKYYSIFSFCVLGAAFNYLSAIANLLLTALEEHVLQKNIMIVCVLINIIIMYIFVEDLGLIILVGAFVLTSFLRLLISTWYAFYLLNHLITPKHICLK